MCKIPDIQFVLIYVFIAMMSVPSDVRNQYVDTSTHLYLLVHEVNMPSIELAGLVVAVVAFVTVVVLSSNGNSLSHH